METQAHYEKKVKIKKSFERKKMKWKLLVLKLRKTYDLDGPGHFYSQISPQKFTHSVVGKRPSITKRIFIGVMQRVKLNNSYQANSLFAILV